MTTTQQSSHRTSYLQNPMLSSTLPNQTSSYQLMDIMKNEIISKVLQELNVNNNKTELMMITNCKIWNQTYSNGQLITNILNRIEEQHNEFRSDILTSINDFKSFQAQSIELRFKEIQINMKSLIDNKANTLNSDDISTKLSKISVDIDNLKKHIQTSNNKSCNNNTKLNRLIKETTNIKKNVSEIKTLHNSKTDARLSTPKPTKQPKNDNEPNTKAKLNQMTYANNYNNSDKLLSIACAPLTETQSNSTDHSNAASIVINNHKPNTTTTIESCNGFQQPTINDKMFKTSIKSILQKTPNEIIKSIPNNNIKYTSSPNNLSPTDIGFNCADNSKYISTPFHSTTTIDGNNEYNKSLTLKITSKNHNNNGNNKNNQYQHGQVPLRPKTFKRNTHINNIQDNKNNNNIDSFFKHSINKSLISSPILVEETNMEMPLTDTDISDPSDSEYYDSSPNYEYSPSAQSVD